MLNSFDKIVHEDYGLQIYRVELSTSHALVRGQGMKSSQLRKLDSKVRKTYELPYSCDFRDAKLEFLTRSHSSLDQIGRHMKAIRK